MSRKSLLFSLIALTALLTLSLSTPDALAQPPDALPPQVIDIWPLPGVELTPIEPVAITFDQPMDQGSVRSAFTLDPRVAVDFVWVDDRTLNLTPMDEWPRDLVLAAAINTGARSQDGVALRDAVRFDLQTIRPLQVADVTPAPGTEGVDIDARIVVSFDRPVVPLVSTVDLADLPDPLNIKPPVAGTGEWINTSLYAFTPTEPMGGSTTYTVTLREGLTSVDGARLDEPFEWAFVTLPPEVLSVTPNA
ncbi:MAG: Ig-like domain-containing protein, partial [Chloroflexi bacterium]|nr:Ig-like domain-containing protein [Chloroflexota bacterium]